MPLTKYWVHESDFHIAPGSAKYKQAHLAADIEELLKELAQAVLVIDQCIMHHHSDDDSYLLANPHLHLAEAHAEAQRLLERLKGMP